MVRHGSRQRSTTEWISIFPMCTSSGSCARCFPSGVSRSSWSSACMLCRTPMAWVRALESGGVSARARSDARLPAPVSPERMLRTCMQRLCRGTRRISGAWCSLIRRHVLRLKVRKHAPRWTRPALPRRCFAAAWLTQVSLRWHIPMAASKPISLTRPQSMTQVTSSMVMEVSATFVESTTLRTFLDGRSNTRDCWLVGRAPCSGSTISWLPKELQAFCTASLSARVRCRREISGAPGRKMRMQPGPPPDTFPPVRAPGPSLCSNSRI
mmetsp:Transcript_21181/g.58793  ORF Transcript_21181/g.58793 Transcript_21181/m.58793 type:complete len:268 (-) Transcript_21181:3009-3812(-)